MQNAGVWAGVMFLIYASGMFWQALSLKYYTPFGPGPGLFPRWLSGMLIVVSLLFIWQSIKEDVITFRDIFPTNKAFVNVASVWGAAIGFMLILNFVGFITASSLLLFTLFIRGYCWKTSLALAVGTSVFMFLIFNNAFGLPLPVNMWGW
ncbi:MAG: tripartite tricarboxylate transporter family receptor [Firmicutes bacterium]|nr:tripartite tricarboxylate transporter family receptor [Bacillota bacterium]